MTNPYFWLINQFFVRVDGADDEGGRLHHRYIELQFYSLRADCWSENKYHIRLDSTASVCVFPYCPLCRALRLKDSLSRTTLSRPQLFRIVSVCCRSYHSPSTSSSHAPWLASVIVVQPSRFLISHQPGRTLITPTRIPTTMPDSASLRSASPSEITSGSQFHLHAYRVRDRIRGSFQ